MSTDTRQAFEAAISDSPFELPIERYGEESAWPGSYKRINVDLAWCMWQAATTASQAELARLQAEVAQLNLAEEGAKTAFAHVVEQKHEIERENTKTRGLLDAAYSDIRRLAGLQAEVEGLRKDAERYRWIRANGEPDAGLAYSPDWSGAMYDAAIDAALAAPKEKPPI